MNLFWWVSLGYLAGSFPTGYLVALCIKRVDIRTIGSGGTGATNVGRLLGNSWAKAVAVIDMLKGALPMVCAMLLAVEDPWIVPLAGFAGVVGHNYPVWLSFRGGKGVATTYGVVFFMNPWISFVVALAGGAVWLALLKLKGYVSLASMASLWCLPIFALLLSLPLPQIIVMSALAALATLRHKDNIKRLARGEESRFGRNRDS
ncbi:MAG: glycerol-3-phosphate 1-O-acyltransferase PlsY [Synergistaceae bacterium]|nr:glycerol-3-phosphate 1-O-acyltransferase PlsY [Synergistaceae bacterium]